MQEKTLFYIKPTAFQHCRSDGDGDEDGGGGDEDDDDDYYFANLKILGNKIPS